MSFLKDSTLQKIREHLQLQDLQIHIFKNDFKDTNEMRRHNRQSAINVIKQMLKRKSIKVNEAQAQRELTELESLAEPPQLSFAGLSFSHCPSHFGFAVSLKAKSIGFDIEDSERISEKVVARISSAKEQQDAPCFAAIWTAKEAAFKTFFRQTSVPNTISQIQLHSWQPLTSEIFAYQFNSSHISDLHPAGQGVELQKLCLNLSVAKF